MTATAIKAVAKKLGNKPSTCRKYYIHPAVLDSYMDAALLDGMKRFSDADSPTELRCEEMFVLDLVTSRQPETVIKPTKAA